MFSVFVTVVISCSFVRYAASSYSPSRCNPARHICHGRCPNLPLGAPLPPPEEPEGLCLWDSETEACVCWLHNPSLHHLHTLFKCQESVNTTTRHVMCLAPTVCFPPGSEPGCLIIPQCACITPTRGAKYGQWRSVLAMIHRSNVAVEPQNDVPTEKPSPESREFNMKHLLFLLAFVIAPLLCWCLLTFFHEGRCRKKHRTPESEAMRSHARDQLDAEELAPGSSCLLPPQQPPTAPKYECPPPYRETVNPSESLLLVADCGPPPSYEDAIRDRQGLQLGSDTV